MLNGGDTSFQKKGQTFLKVKLKTTRKHTENVFDGNEVRC